MQTLDVTGAAGPTIAQTPAKGGADTKTGLTEGEVQTRLKTYGPNALVEKQKSTLAALAGYFRAPIPWMIEAAALMAFVVGDWGDFAIITSLLLFNALLGFWEEHEASNALDALKSSLALKARALRNRRWQEVDARTLVPGDIVRLYLGDVVPADCTLIAGGYISIDQSALTGESLPVSKKSGANAYSGSIVKQGEMTAVVTATGANTFFGRTAKLMAGGGQYIAFPASRDADRQFSDYPRARLGGDSRGRSSFRYAWPLRSSRPVKAGRNRSDSSRGLSARSDAGSFVGDHGVGRATTGETQGYRVAIRSNRGTGRCRCALFRQDRDVNREQAHPWPSAAAA